MKSRLFAVLIIGCTIGIVLILSKHNQLYWEQRGLPPDYQLACDGKGHYAARFPIGKGAFYVLQKDKNEFMTTKVQAIKRAWQHYADMQELDRRQRAQVYEPIPNWQPCEGTNVP